MSYKHPVFSHICYIVATHVIFKAVIATAYITETSNSVH